MDQLSQRLMTATEKVWIYFKKTHSSTLIQQTKHWLI